MGMVKNGWAQPDHRTLKLTVCQKWADGTNWFLHVGTVSGKLKFDVVKMTMVMFISP